MTTENSILLYRLNSLANTKSKLKEQGEDKENILDEAKMLKINQEMNENLESVTQKYIYLWQHLDDDTPDIDKVYYSIQGCIKEIAFLQNYYKKNSIIRNSTLLCKKNYGLFLKMVLDQVENSKEILEEYFIEREKLNRVKQDIKNLQGNDILTTLSDPLLIFSREFVNLK